jgi:bifunctional non-homologous end joining protein LigD
MPRKQREYKRRPGLKSASEVDAVHRSESRSKRLTAFTLSKSHRLAPIVPATPERVRAFDQSPDAHDIELAWDGHRLLVTRVGEDVRLQSEDYRQWSDTFPTLEYALRRLPSQRFVAEGWVCALGESRRPSFEALRSHVAGEKSAEVMLALTDLFQLEDEDLRSLPLSARKQRLGELVKGAPNTLVVSPPLAGRSEELLKSLAGLAVPGFIARPSDQPHPPASEHSAFVVTSSEQPVSWDRSLSAPTKISNPTKVLYPRDGFTKTDVARYYADIAPVLLPYLADRPVVAQRWPDGIDDFTWYQHRVPPRAPDYLRAVFIEGNRRFVIPNRDALMWVVNLAGLTLHGWASRVDTLGEPDWVVLDLDPGEKTRWEHTISVAVAVRRMLELLELPSVIKTSGQKGLHVMIPIAPGQTTLLAHELARRAAFMIARLMPDMASVELDKERRAGRLFLDHLQNYVGKSLVLPYSLRAADGAPVSTPLAWSEIGPGLDPSLFTLKTLRDRVDRVGDLAAPLLAGGALLAPAIAKLEAAMANSS